MGVERLEHGAHLLPGSIEICVRPPQNGRPTAVRADEPEDRAERRRLPCAVRSKETRDLAGVNREGQVVDGERRSESLREPLDLDHP